MSALPGNNLDLDFVLHREVLTGELYRNWDLHVTSSCHRIYVYSVNRTKPQTAKRLKQMEEKGISLMPITQPLEFNLEDDDTYLSAVRAQGGRDPEE